MEWLPGAWGIRRGWEARGPELSVGLQRHRGAWRRRGACWASWKAPNQAAPARGLGEVFRDVQLSSCCFTNAAI